MRIHPLGFLRGARPATPRSGFIGIPTTPAVCSKLHEYRLAERMLGAVGVAGSAAAWPGAAGGKANAAAPDVRQLAHAKCRRHVGSLLAPRKTATMPRR